MERYSNFEKLKEKRSLKPKSKAEAKLLENNIIAFIELLKKAALERKNISDRKY